MDRQHSNDIPTLYVMIGVSGSGKSTYANHCANKGRRHAAVVSTDDIRMEVCGDRSDQSHNDAVFKLYYRRIRQDLEHGYDVYADATNINMKERRVLLNMLGKVQCNKVAVVMAVSRSKCYKRDKERNNCSVGNEIIDKQIARFQVPFKEEGFDEIHVVHDTAQPLSLMSMIGQMKNFDQKNPHHNQTLWKHSCITFKYFIDNEHNNIFDSAYKFGVLFHDIGKLFTQTIDNNGIAHYYAHDNVGAYIFLTEMSGEFAYNCTFWDDMLDVTFLINYHMLPFHWDTDKAKETWHKRFGDFKYDLLMSFHECDVKR